MPSALGDAIAMNGIAYPVPGVLQCWRFRAEWKDGAPFVNGGTAWAEFLDTMDEYEPPFLRSLSTLEDRRCRLHVVEHTPAGDVDRGHTTGTLYALLLDAAVLLYTSDDTKTAGQLRTLRLQHLTFAQVVAGASTLISQHMYHGLVNLNWTSPLSLMSDALLKLDMTEGGPDANAHNINYVTTILADGDSTGAGYAGMLPAMVTAAEQPLLTEEVAAIAIGRAATPSDASLTMWHIHAETCGASHTTRRAATVHITDGHGSVEVDGAEAAVELTGDMHTVLLLAILEAEREAGQDDVAFVPRAPDDLLLSALVTGTRLEVAVYETHDRAHILHARERMACAHVAFSFPGLFGPPR